MRWFLFFALAGGFALPALARDFYFEEQYFPGSDYWVATELVEGTDSCGSATSSYFYFAFDAFGSSSWAITEISLGGCPDFEPLLSCVSQQGEGQAAAFSISTFAQYALYLEGELGVTVTIDESVNPVKMTICEDTDDGTAGCEDADLDPTIDIWGIDSGVANPTEGAFTEYGYCSLADYINCIVIDAAINATTTGKGKGKGRFVSHLAKELEYLVEVGIITEEEKDQLVSTVVMVSVSDYPVIAESEPCFEVTE